MAGEIVMWNSKFQSLPKFPAFCHSGGGRCRWRRRAERQGLEGAAGAAWPAHRWLCREGRAAGVADFLIVPLKQGKKEGSGGNMGKIQTSFERRLSDIWAHCYCVPRCWFKTCGQNALLLFGVYAGVILLGCVKKTLKLLGFHQLESGGHTRRKWPDFTKKKEDITSKNDQKRFDLANFLRISTK